MQFEREQNCYQREAGKSTWTGPAHPSGRASGAGACVLEEMGEAKEAKEVKEMEKIVLLGGG